MTRIYFSGKDLQLFAYIFFVFCVGNTINLYPERNKLFLSLTVAIIKVYNSGKAKKIYKFLFAVRNVGSLDNKEVIILQIVLPEFFVLVLCFGKVN